MKDSIAESIDWDRVENLWKKLMLVCDRYRIELTADGDVPWEDLAIALLWSTSQVFVHPSAARVAGRGTGERISR
ncbi:MAG: hypothetical protein E5W82_14795 [Mesorhizobium sp.]|nr:MAG: hypothetical protein E5W82_14795 [Mesorhizobium sp.]